MKKMLIVLLGLALLMGCGKVERFTASWTGYSEMCISGVTYIQFTSGASVKYLPDGKIATCK
jgi:uncharacterized protein YceK